MAKMPDMLAPPSPVSFGVASDPADMTPPQRRREIAAILARGVLRLRQAAQGRPGSRSSRTPENLAEQFVEMMKAGFALGAFRAGSCPSDAGADSRGIGGHALPLIAFGYTMFRECRGFATNDRDVRDLPDAEESPMAKGNNAQKKNIKKPKQDKAAKKKKQA